MALGADPVGNRNKIVQYIKANELNDMIQLHGNLSFDDLSTMAFYADACIVPSKQEGFGILAAQFSLLKNILIVSHKGALPEVVGGKIVWVNEITETCLVEAIEKASRGEFIELPVKNFSWSNVISDYEKILYEVIR